MAGEEGVWVGATLVSSACGNSFFLPKPDHFFAFSCRNFVLLCEKHCFPALVSGAAACKGARLCGRTHRSAHKAEELRCRAKTGQNPALSVTEERATPERACASWQAESRTLCAFMSDFSLSSVYLTVSLFVLPHGTSKPIASGTVIPKIFAVRFSAALFFLLKILLVGAINKFRISSKFVIISGISVAEIAELGSGISVSGSMALSAIG